LLFDFSKALAQPAPIAQWSFDKIEQNTFLGAGTVPKLKPATIYGEVKVIPGKVGNAASFLGSPLGQISLPLDLFALTQGAFSTEFWFRPGSAPADYGVCVEAGSVGGFSIRINGSRRLLLSTTGSWNVVTTTDTFPEAVWVHVALTSDAEIVRFYVNGREVGKVPLTETLRLGSSVQVGARTVRSKNPDGTFKEEVNQGLSGDIDALKFYNRPLTPAEVAAAAKAAR
jgi:hypothetical protein